MPTDYKTLLQFGDDWFRLGLLTEERLRRLGERYEASDDKAKEHYRYGIFHEFLAAHRPLNPGVAEALYELGERDPDRPMGEAIMHRIAELPECPETVLERARGSDRKHLRQAARREVV